MTTEAKVDRGLAVAIAKDVLRQIGREDVPLLIDKFCGYLQFVRSAPAKPTTEDPVDRVQANCHVCMLGGLFLSRLRLGPASLTFFGDDLERDEVVETLTDAFTPADLDLIESAFECLVATEWKPDCDDEDDLEAILEAHEERCIAAADWGESLGCFHSNRVARARAICKNIIANGGRFIVPRNH